ncbi:hypothetical protein V3C99_018122 [Haemonchus contortus]|uniref:Ovule protein n=1 Tax=Haemonchus contortus TaxID=6289 RepID=A0A7I4Z272_HAECO
MSTLSGHRKIDGFYLRQRCVGCYCSISAVFKMNGCCDIPKLGCDALSLLARCACECRPRLPERGGMLDSGYICRTVLTFSSSNKVPFVVMYFVLKSYSVFSSGD